MKLKNYLIDIFKMKMIKSTKHNEVWECMECIMIYNKVTGLIKLKQNL